MPNTPHPPQAPQEERGSGVAQQFAAMERALRHRDRFVQQDDSSEITARMDEARRAAGITNGGKA